MILTVFFEMGFKLIKQVLAFLFKKYGELL